MTNVKDVANLAQVSTATVSRVLTGLGNVKESNKEKVWKAVRELEYYPNSIGRQLRKMETKTILVIVPDITNSFFSGILRGIERIAMIKGYQVLLGDTQNKEADDYFTYLYQKKVDGMILLTSKIDLENLKNLYDHFPIVLACEGVESVDIPTVSINNMKSAEEITQYLIDLGHKNIIHVAGPLDGILGKNRLQGFKNTMKKNSLEINNDFIIEGDFSLNSGYKIGEKLLNKKSSPSAIFAANDEMAIGIIKVFKKHGVKVPEDVSIIGFDNIKASEIVEPELTTFSQPTYKIGEKAMGLLLALMISKNEKIDSIFLNGSILERETTCKQ